MDLGASRGGPRSRSLRKRNVQKLLKVKCINLVHFERKIKRLNQNNMTINKKLSETMLKQLR